GPARVLEEPPRGDVDVVPPRGEQADVAPRRDRRPGPAAGFQHQRLETAFQQVCRRSQAHRARADDDHGQVVPSNLAHHHSSYREPSMSIDTAILNHLSMVVNLCEDEVMTTTAPAPLPLAAPADGG